MMTGAGETVLRLIAFQAGWFACVLGAARGVPGLGPGVVGLFALGHLIARRRRWEREALLLAAAALVGYAADSALVLAGVLRFPPQAVLGGPSTLWMVALWVNLALTLNGPLGWLRGRYVLAALLGFCSGPLAYLAGAELGAAAVSEPRVIGLGLVGLEWLCAMPLLVWLAEVAGRPSPGRGATDSEDREGERGP